MNQFSPVVPTRIDRVGQSFAQINQQALAHFDELMEQLLPDGKNVGKEYQALNPLRDDHGLGSFLINRETGAWGDFADEQPEGSRWSARGGDLIGLAAFLLQLDSQTEAKLWVEDFIGKLGSQPAKAAVSRSVKAQAEQLTLVMPVPDSALDVPTCFYSLGVPSSSWGYKNADGQVLGYVLRFNLPDGKKDIRPLTYHVDNAGRGGWYLKGFPDPRPLYGLDKLAAQPDAPVLIVEGEKAADAAQLLFPNHVVVTTMNGAQSPQKTDLSPLVGRSIQIWPDADEAGQGYAEKVAELVRDLDPQAAIAIMKPIVVKAGLDEQGRAMLEPGFEAPKSWDAADALAEDWTAEHIALLGEDAFEALPGVDLANAEGKSNSYLVGDFLVKADGVFLRKENEDGDVYFIKLSSKIEVVALTRDAESTGWGLLLEFTDQDGVSHRWAMPRELLGSGDTYRSYMLSHGATLLPSRPLKDAFAKYLLEANPEARVLSVSNPGWYKDVFVLPDKAYGPNAEKVVLQTSAPAEMDIYSQRDNLAVWQSNVAALCQGNSRLVLAVSAAFVGPVLKLLNIENGGFHFRGNSSTGKTICLKTAASVWGGENYVRRWRATSNALESTALTHNDTVLLLDELSQADPVHAGEAAYMIGNGVGKARANRQGIAAAPVRWRVVFLSTGEISLADHMATGGRRTLAGQEIRMVDIPADAGAEMGLFENIHGAGSPREFADSLRDNTHKFYGLAGRSFVEALADPARQEGILESIKTKMDAFITTNLPDGASGQVSRVLQRFALTAAVGEACIELGILPWPVGEAEWGAKRCFDAFVAARGGVGNQEAEQAINQVRAFLERHGESRFPLWELGAAASDRNINNRTGFRRLVEDGERFEYFILPEAYRTMVCEGLDYREVTKVLLERGFLVTGNDGKPQSPHCLPGMGTKRVYRISPDLMGGGTAGG